jgi:hypothetical protein
MGTDKVCLKGTLSWVLMCTTPLKGTFICKGNLPFKGTVVVMPSTLAWATNPSRGTSTFKGKVVST